GRHLRRAREGRPRSVGGRRFRLLYWPGRLRPRDGPGARSRAYLALGPGVAARRLGSGADARHLRQDPERTGGLRARAGGVRRRAPAVREGGPVPARRAARPWRPPVPPRQLALLRASVPARTRAC